MKLSDKNKPELIRELFFFGAIGLVVNIVGYAVFLFCVSTGMSPQAAFVVGYVIGLSISYLLNRTLTFRSTVRLSYAGPRFIILNLVGLVFCLVALTLLIDLFMIPSWLSQLVVTVVYAIGSFLVQRVFVFIKGEK